MGEQVQVRSRRCCGGTKRKKSWADLSPAERTGVVTIGSIQLALAATAWVDLARRPAAQVNGPKAAWALAIAVNFVGPIAYFLRGRRPV
jgi:hypothetical protein